MEHPAHDPELKKYMKIIAKSNRWDQIILRGCLAGVFTAVGTTIGFALLLIIAGQFVTTFKQIPLLDTFLAQTKLDVLIENQLQRINQTDQGTENTSGGSSSSAAVTSLKYTNADFKLAFTYPSTLNSVKEDNGQTAGSKIISFNGKGSLEELNIYVNQQVTVGGVSSQRFIVKPNMDSIVMNMYDSGAIIDNKRIDNAVYFAEVKIGSNTYTFLGYADSISPKLAREIFANILTSATFE